MKWGSDPLEPQCGRITLHHGALEAARLVRFGILSKVHSNFVQYIPQKHMNITLIGMPGSGKSYLGKILAESLGYTCIELDLITELRYKRPLEEVLTTIGEAAFLAEQANDAITQTTDKDNLIISPGGSIIYSTEAMQHLKTVSKVIYLKTSIEIIKERIKEVPRGIVGLNNKTFEELYIERTNLYEHWADYILDAEQDSTEIVTAIKNILLK